jgi:hypothetical protein
MADKSLPARELGLFECEPNAQFVRKSLNATVVFCVLILWALRRLSRSHARPLPRYRSS